MIGVHYRSSDIEVESPTGPVRESMARLLSNGLGVRRRKSFSKLSKQGKEVSFRRQMKIMAVNEFSGTLDGGRLLLEARARQTSFFMSGKFIVE